MAEPKSFKIDRKSYFATKLKSLISDHLLRSYPDFYDDVLAEYITVLVCNGKNQIQAREDLEAFLGENSRQFVSWLWCLLLKYESQLTGAVSSEKKNSSPHDTDKESDTRHKNSAELQCQEKSSYILLGKKGDTSAKSCKSYDKMRSEDHPTHPEERPTRSIQSSVPRSVAIVANSDSSAEVPSPIVRHRVIGADRFDVEALAMGSNCKASSSEPASLPRRRPASKPETNLAGLPRAARASGAHSSRGDRPQVNNTEKGLKRSISPLPSSHDDKRRCSVWDRLGKPLKDVPSEGQLTDTNFRNSSDNIEEQIHLSSRLIPRSTEKIGRVSSSRPMPTEKGSRISRVHQIKGEGGDNNKDDSTELDPDVEEISQVPSVSNIWRKRQFGELNSQTDTQIVMQAPNRPEVPPVASQIVGSQVQDVKQRLRQVELEMAKLKAKQKEMQKEKTNVSADSSTEISCIKAAAGLVNLTKEDIDSRTIRVTNVHYAASKEHLLMHFCTCGPIVNVIADDIAAPQRSAYITFESKESANRAFGLNGTTFFSRTIMVSNKGNTKTPAVSSAQVGKRMHGHLQWRRETLSAPNLESQASTNDQTKTAADRIPQLGMEWRIKIRKQKPDD